MTASLDVAPAAMAVDPLTGAIEMEPDGRRSWSRLGRAGRRWPRGARLQEFTLQVTEPGAGLIQGYGRSTDVNVNGLAG